MIHLEPQYLADVRSILSQFVPNAVIMAFGSRVRGNHKKFSDLDLMINNSQKLDYITLSQIKDAFTESNLPIKVDVVDWHDINEEFRKAINASCTLL